MLEKVNLADKFSRFSDTWNPRIVGEVQGMQVRLAKLKGEFVWHRHDQQDELFLVVKGRLLLKFRDGEVWLEPGELFIVPGGVEHCPVADEEVQVLVIVPAAAVNTGNVSDSPLTRAELSRI